MCGTHPHVASLWPPSFFCEIIARVIEMLCKQLPLASLRLPMRNLLALVLGALSFAGFPLALSDHPARSQTGMTVRVILTVPPGGSIAFLARILTDHISTTRSQAIVIES